MKKFNDILYEIDAEDLPVIKIPELSDKQKNRIRQLAENVSENPQSIEKRIRFPSVKRLAAVCTAFMLIVVSVLVYPHGKNIFRDIFQPLSTVNENSNGANEVIINKSDEADGITLTVEKVVRDGNLFMIYYNIRNESGDLKAQYSESLVYLSCDTFTFSILEKNGIEWKSVSTYMGTIVSERSIVKNVYNSDCIEDIVYAELGDDYTGIYRITIDKLYIDKYPADNIYLTEDKLSVQFTIPDNVLSADSTIINIDKTVNIGDMSVYVRSIEVSYITIRVNIECDEYTQSIYTWISFDDSSPDIISPQWFNPYTQPQITVPMDITDAPIDIERITQIALSTGYTDDAEIITIYQK